MSNPIYDDLEQADGNDLIDEHQRLWLIIAPQLDDTQLLVDFENVTNELAKREEQ